MREIALKVDSITLIVERLEELAIRAHEVATVLMLPPSGPGSRLVTELALGRSSGVTARTKEEAEAGEDLQSSVSILSHFESEMLDKPLLSNTANHMHSNTHILTFSFYAYSKCQCLSW